MREFMNNMEQKCKKIMDIFSQENEPSTNMFLNNLIDSEEEEINDICNESVDESTQEYESEPVVVVNPEIVQPQPSELVVEQQESEEEEPVQEEPVQVQEEPVQVDEEPVQVEEEPVQVEEEAPAPKRRGRKKKQNPPIESLTELSNENMLKNYNGKDLRKFLKLKKLSTNGKKYELMLRVFKSIMHPDQLTDDDKPKKKGRRQRVATEVDQSDTIIEHSLKN